MAATQMTLWDDLIGHLTDWCGANATQEARRDARRASLGALRDLATASRWSYYYQRGRVVTSAPYQTGTVEYDHTGGSAERLVTLTDGVWPAWAAQGELVIDSVVYEISTRISDTQLTLTTGSNPGEDLDAGTTYALIRDRYPLPINCNAIGVLTMAQRAATLVFEHPSTWLERQRIYQGVAEPRTYTITGSPDFIGGMSLSVWPPPSGVYQLEMIYSRYPRQLKVDSFSTGTVTCTSGSAVVVGSGTAWASRLVGSVLRVGTDPTRAATGWAGDNAPQLERTIVSVDSATQITLDDVLALTSGSCKYMVSDPVDVEPGAMLTALLRGCEYQMAHARHQKDRVMAQTEYTRALLLAREADSRSYRDESAGSGGVRGYRLRDFPSGPDVR